MDTSNVSLGLSRVCGCQVEIIAVKVICCTATVFDTFGNFFSELYGFFEAFRVRNALWPKLFLKKKRTKTIAVADDTQAAGAILAWAAPAVPFHNPPSLWAALVVRSSSGSDFYFFFKCICMCMRMCSAGCFLTSTSFLTPWSAAPQNIASAQAKVVR